MKGNRRMDYKKIIKDRERRMRILQCFRFIPDKQMIKLQYRIKTGRKLNLKSPKRFTEKLQWYKLYYRNPLMCQCVDKYDVREYVKSKGLKLILNECYGIYENVDEIDFQSLPKQFVIKDTLGGGGTSVIIVKNKDIFNLNSAKSKMQKWVEIPECYIDDGREWPYYSGRKHRIIIEKYIEADEHLGGLIEYKFFCFNGKVHYLYVLVDRELGRGVSLGIFDEKFNKLPYSRVDERPLLRTIEKPDNYQNMIDIAETLSADFPHARIDLFNQDNHICFGEITFFDGSGYMEFTPDAFDYEIGGKFILPQAFKDVSRDTLINLT